MRSALTRARGPVAFTAILSLLFAILAGVSAQGAFAAAAPRLPTATIEFDDSIPGAGSVTINNTASMDGIFNLIGASPSVLDVRPAEVDPDKGGQLEVIDIHTFSNATPGQIVRLTWTSVPGGIMHVLVEGVAPLIETPDPDPVDTDGDGVFDGDDKCPSTPAGSQVNEEGCAIGLAPVVALQGVTNAPSADAAGTASFSFTNLNEVSVTYQVTVGGVYEGEVTLPPGGSTTWSVERTAGTYAVTLRAAGSVTDPVSFTITADTVVVPTPTEKPVEPTEKPTEVAPPATTKPTPEASAPATEEGSKSPAPTKAAPSSPTTSQSTVASKQAAVVGSGQRGGSLPQSVEGVSLNQGDGGALASVFAMLAFASAFASVMLALALRRKAH